MEKCSIVHSATRIESFDYRCKLAKEPVLGMFVWYKDEFIMIPAQLVGELDAVLFGGDALHVFERKVPIES